MKGGRTAKLNRLLQTTLAELLPTVKDPAVRGAPLLAVAGVRATSDLAYAKIFVSVGGDDAARHAAIAGLQRARGYLRGQLGHRLTMRAVPELTFELDTTGDSAARIETILHEIAGEQRSAAPVEVTLQGAADQLVGATRVLVTSHPNPDGDAIGSTLGAFWALRALGKEVVAFNPDGVPSTFAFLAGAEQVVTGLPEGAPFDLTLILDCSDARMFAREPSWSKEQLGTVLVVDHHKTLDGFGDMVYRDQTAASVGVLLYRLVGALEVPLTLPIAEALYCSILSDTGSFRYQNTNPEALKVAARLIGQGVQPWRVASGLYETRPRGQLRLLARVLETLEVSEDGRAAALTVTEQMLHDTGCSPDMVDGFVNYARGLHGVEVAILVRPTDESVRVSLRSAGRVDVSDIALAFGGGGHHNAAGFTLRDAAAGALLERLFAEVAERTAGAGEV